MEPFKNLLNPAGVQELIDFGLYGFALSRFASLWVGFKCVTAVVESIQRASMSTNMHPTQPTPMAAPAQ